MKRIFVLPGFAVLGAAVLAITMSSFAEPKQEAVQGNTYFQFDVSTSPTEANLEDPAKWSVVSLPASNPCTNGTIAPCIANVVNSSAGILPADLPADRITKFVNHLKAQLPLPSGAYDYMQITANVNFERP